MNQPRVLTEDEVIAAVFRHIDNMVDYWATLDSSKTTKERMDGLVFSILAMLDGCSIGIPGFDLVCTPHEDDAEYHRKEGENWFPPEERISRMLHELWATRRNRR